MSKKMEFFVFLIEQYAGHKKTTADQVLNQWDEMNLTDYIYDMYELYHTERLENAFEDIDKMILKAETAKT
ncbi:MAG: DUF3791 domain-containing protein [Lachnospiraceae bacterium]|nr:DUF3791 domain-containing protein [Lachnospiraceae bacterium]